MKSLNILVTGGAGFIASHITDAYVAAGHNVTILDNLSTGERRNINAAATFIEGDIRDDAAIDKALAKPIDLVSHHAAQMDVRRSVAEPAFDADVNIVGTLRLFQKAIDKGVKKLIFASSGGAMYGEPHFVPQTEDHPVAPLSPYGCSKLAIEHYLHYFRVGFGISAVSLRYGNVYGPRQRKDGEAGVVAIFGGKLLAGEGATINGTGGQTRDYVFVEDVVRANMAASAEGIDGAFNVGTGIETSVNELYSGLCEAAGVREDATNGPAKPGEQMRSVLDGTKLRKLAGLPEPVRLELGLARTYASIRDAET
ncbi:MAG TPA: NAD-dependent epimerase/dehydratase family protein [Thermoanaerobaculia bacterium]|nr:NAD-dependent epimerase/dehydratase family protein [Thermoanaerobaculia bacterium]